MYVVAGGDHSLAAVQNLGSFAAGGSEAQHMWPECKGQGLAALPGPSLTAGLQEEDLHKKACCSVWLNNTLQLLIAEALSSRSVPTCCQLLLMAAVHAQSGDTLNAYLALVCHS